MNVYDSEQMASLLEPLGYKLTLVPEEADLVILNTCHIREKATEKVFSDLGRFRNIQKNRASQGLRMLLAVAGCVAQAEGAEILRRAPYVDMIFGPQSYHKLPEFINKVTETNNSVTDLAFPVEDKFDTLQQAKDSSSVSAFLTIQEGCNKFCTFCVVPYTRGAEFSRPVKDIINEARRLVRNGAKEIILLGQNVNAYHGTGNGKGEVALDYLICFLAEIDGLERIRFTTSHPSDMSDRLIATFGSIPKLMPMLHLPVQSGSNKVLRAMNRRYTIAEYLQVIDKLRSVRADIALSGDFIVGFPGETGADFDKTIRLVEKVGYAQSFSFKYSPRPGTPASSSSMQIDDREKSFRLHELQRLLSEQQLAFNSSFVGDSLNVLFERPGKSKGQLTGRSQYMQVVHINSKKDNIGDLLEINIEHASQNSLFGQEKTNYCEMGELVTGSSF